MNVSPSDPEKVYLRLLLLHVPGAKSFDDLKMIEGTIAVSFREACIRNHHLTDDSEYIDALTEASGFQMPRQLRNMFATVSACCHPSDPLYLWDNYKDAMIEDLARNTIIYDAAMNIALSDINTILLENGTNCASNCVLLIMVYILMMNQIQSMKRSWTLTN